MTTTQETAKWPPPFSVSRDYERVTHGSYHREIADNVMTIKNVRVSKTHSFTIRSLDGQQICCIYGDESSDDARSLSEFIVRACNAHDDLLAACKTAMRVAIHNNMRLQFPEMYDELSTAISRAEGGAA